MTQMMQSQLLEEAARDLRRGRRCGLCRIYPGHMMVCGERGREVTARMRPCRVYDEMTAEELAEVKEKALASQKAWYEANKEKVLASQKAWYEANKEKALANKKAWREANKEKVLANKKAWREANKEKVLASQKAWREANKEKVLASQKAWYEANKEKALASQKAWREANRDKLMLARLLQTADPELYEQLLKEAKQ